MDWMIMGNSRNVDPIIFLFSSSLIGYGKRLMNEFWAMPIRQRESPFISEQMANAGSISSLRVGWLANTP
jgi:hypothetical protein